MHTPDDWELIRKRCEEISPLSAEYLRDVLRRIQSKGLDRSIFPSMSHHELHLLNDANTKLIHIHPPIAGRPMVTITVFHRESETGEFQVVRAFEGDDLDQSLDVFERYVAGW